MPSRRKPEDAASPLVLVRALGAVFGVDAGFFGTGGDLRGTGGALKAAEDLVANIPDSVAIGSVVIFEIDCLKGRQRLTKPFESLIHLTDPE